MADSKTQNVFLIGYRGTGKTSIGKKLSNRLSLPFVDIDELIVKNAKMPVPELFAKLGEPKFRDFETEALKRVCEKKNQIVSCGGGIVVRDENISLLKSNGFVILLSASPETIFRRIHLDSNRPSLTGKNPMDEIIFLLNKRAPLYEKAKDFEISTDRNISSCVNEILSELEKRNILNTRKQPMNCRKKYQVYLWFSYHFI